MSSYKSILKSTGLVAGVQVFQLFFGLVRNKAVALMLGTSGFGTWGLYQTFIEMVSSFSTLGVDQSGVREIAKNSEDRESTAKSIFALRTILLFFSLVSLGIAVVFSRSISKSLFKTDEYHYGIIIASVAVLLNGIFKGQKSILNGVRDMKGLALSQIIGSAAGTALTICLLFFFGYEGIPIYLLAISLTAAISCHFFVRKLGIVRVKPTYYEFKEESKSLITLGLGFSASAILASLMTYLARAYLNQKFDLSTVGIYQASWTISNLYIGTILTAMGVDFMPRLMNVSGDNKRLVALINEQIEMGTLIANLGIVCIITFSPLILQVLYSSEFAAGTEIIRWQILGVAMRVIGFPFGHALMSQRRTGAFVLVQTVFWIGDYFLLIMFSTLFGADGLGINYFVSYSVYLLLIGLMCRKYLNYTPTVLLKKIILISFTLIGLSWAVASYLSGPFLWTAGSLLILISGLWVNRYLSVYMNFSIWKTIQTKIRK